MPSQIDEILSEHRSIRAVLDGMNYLVRERRTAGAAVDPKVFGAMLYYLDVFAERVHHPREEAGVFEVVRHRNARMDAILDELDREHESGESAMRSLEQAYLRYLEGGDRELAAFARKVESYVENYLEHMRREEELVLPYARELLAAGESTPSAAAGADIADPLHGAESTDYRKLFARIVNLAPPPIGLGPVPEQPHRRSWLP
jgi:hemerythrin-like domain-containing protein